MSETKREAAMTRKIFVQPKAGLIKPPSYFFVKTATTTVVRIRL